MDLRYAAPMCGWCNVKTSLAMQPVAMLNRQKPGSMSRVIERGLKEANGHASVYHTLANDESKGANHWAKVKSQHDPGAISGLGKG